MTHPDLIELRSQYPAGTMLCPRRSNTSVRHHVGWGKPGAPVEWRLVMELQNSRGVVIGMDLKPDEENDDVCSCVIVALFPQGVFEFDFWDFCDVELP